MSSAETWALTVRIEDYDGSVPDPDRRGLALRLPAIDLFLSAAAPALAQVPAGKSAPQPSPFVDTIPAPRGWTDHPDASRRIARQDAATTAAASSVSINDALPQLLGLVFWGS